MRANGVWLLGDDGTTRPIFFAEVAGSRGHWVKIAMLADPGADRTVFSRDAFARLQFPPSPSADRLAGIGGISEAVSFVSQIRIRRIDGVALTFRGEFAATLSSSALDISLLGRDITNLFALVVDRPGEAVCLLSRGEVYQA